MRNISTPLPTHGTNLLLWHLIVKLGVKRDALNMDHSNKIESSSIH